MNFRIKELALQAGIQDNPDPEGLALFAELIIEECSEVARRTILAGSGVNPDTFTGTVTTVQQIKQHFGDDA
jgi:hypothetical protein